MAEDVPMGALDATPDWRDQEAQLGLDLQRQYEARQAAPKSSWYDKLNAVARTPGRILGALTASPTSPEIDQAAMMPETYVSPLVKNTMDAIGGAVKSGITAPGRALSGEMPMVDPETGHTSEAAIQGAFDTAALAGGGAAAGALAADAAKTAAPVAVAAHAEPFYSGLERAVVEHPQEKMTGEEWARVLANKPGVKKEEMQFTGTHDLLKDLDRAPITKDQLLDHLNENRVQIGEVTKVKGPPLWPRYDGQPSEADFQNEAKYSSYVLPGGENYREKLLTLPQKSFSGDELGKQWYENFTRRGGDPSWEQLSPEKRQSFVEQANESGLKPSGDQYRSSHWDEPNVLLHMRMNDRAVTGAGEDAAKKALHLEELQSDWHQQGRQRGYGNPAQDNFEKIKTELLQKHGVDSLIPLQGAANKSPELAADLRRLDEAYQAAQVEKHQGMPVPDAPFKKTWHELGLKRALHEAAEGGYDRLSWTPGEAQAARYDLSKQVKSIDYTRRGDQTALDIYLPSGERIGKVANNDNELSDMVGREVAEKIANSHGKTRESPATTGGIVTQGTLANLDLKIGGEGMRGFYDKMIPDYLNKIGRPYGVKVQKGETVADKAGWHITPPEHTVSGKWMVKSSDYNSKGLQFDTKAEAEAALAEKQSKAPVHYMDIPPSLKQQLLTKGMPLFEDSSAGEGIAAASRLDDRAGLSVPIDKLSEQAQPYVSPLVKDTMDKIGIKAYHGSPHDFDRFDTSKIGTGEGAQAYGHGLYFAGNEGVAKSYRDTLAPMGVEMFKNGESAGLLKSGQVVNDPSFVEAYNKLIPADVPGWVKSGVMKDIHGAGLNSEGHVDLAKAMESSVARMTKDLPDRAIPGVTDAVKRAYESIGGDVEFRKPGRMYEVNINADPEHFLDWDKPLSEQPQTVRDAIAKRMHPTESFKGPLAARATAAKAGDFSDIDVASALKLLGGYSDPAAASATLREAGIPGIKYLDQGSRVPPVQILSPKDTVHGQWLVKQMPNGQVYYRGADEAAARAAYESAPKPTHNYVVFDDKMIDILRKYGWAGLAAMMGTQESSKDQQ